ncbi:MULTISPECIES: NAD(P)H dehydrogenase assembly family protein [Aphanothece]|uniref:NAD(P)H dehydrogenase assembly family protein n=1 Tax=Aphanothece TaxID=1121 RepID=UPI003984A21B
MADRSRAADDTAAEPAAEGAAEVAAEIAAEVVAEVGSTAPSVDEDQRSEARRWAVGDSACLRGLPRYLKTAEPMPMLRPPDLVDIGEVGVVVAERALGQLAVRFRRGTFLLDSGQLTSPEGLP